MIFKKPIYNYSIALFLLLTFAACNQKSPLEKEALQKIDALESLMKEAKGKSIDVAREETIVWFSKEFIKFANWDENNKEAIAKLFGYERYYTPMKDSLAEILPEFERKKVIEILDKGIEELKKRA